MPQKTPTMYPMTVTSETADQSYLVLQERTGLST